MPRNATQDHKSTTELVSELQSHLADIDADIDRMKQERFRTEAALLALQGRKRPGRPPRVTA